MDPPDTDLSTWPVYDALLPHASAVVDHAEQLGRRGGVERPPSEATGGPVPSTPATPLPLAPDAVARLLNQMGLYQVTRAQFSASEPLLLRALAIDEQCYGAEHSDVARDLNNLAQLLKATNRLRRGWRAGRPAGSVFARSDGSV